MVWALTVSWPYLERTGFLVISDQQSFRCFLRLLGFDSNSGWSRQTIRLAEYEHEVVFNKGSGS